IDLVRQAILALPEHYREVVALCSLGEMSYEQAASVIGCPVGTVRSRLNRAREILVRKLSAVKGPTANSAPNSAMAPPLHHKICSCVILKNSPGIGSPGV